MCTDTNRLDSEERERVGDVCMCMNVQTLILCGSSWETVTATSGPACPSNTPNTVNLSLK